MNVDATPRGLVSLCQGDVAYAGKYISMRPCHFVLRFWIVWLIGEGKHFCNSQHFLIVNGDGKI
jgi:hypothetical protein